MYTIVYSKKCFPVFFLYTQYIQYNQINPEFLFPKTAKIPEASVLVL